MQMRNRKALAYFRTDTTTMRALLALTLLLATAGPAAAVTFFPNLAARRYCQLRSVGVDRDQAITAALREFANTRDQPIMVEFQGKPTDTNIILFVRAITTDCPDLMQ